MDARSAVHFYLNGRPYEVVPASPTQTLLEFLREQLRLTGTKEGCAEGDCGACTVTEASLGPGGRIQYRAINACIRFLAALDGKAAWTVEGIAPAEGGLHPVQQALVDHHGSQCGFCTPGFVMSMYAMYQNGSLHPTREEVLDGLSGNLCRCTGYRPIIDAAMAVGSYASTGVDEETLRLQLIDLKKRCIGMLGIRGDGQQLFAPTSTDEFSNLYSAHPQAVLLAGGTDVALWVTKQLRHLGTILYLGGIGDLHRIDQDDGFLRIAAAVSLNDGYRALVAEYPEADEIWKRFASMPIRNSGTLVGNLANGSPIGDTAPLLIALGSELVLRKGQRRRQIALESLYLDYRKQDREPGEWIEAVLVPRRLPGLKLASYKLSKRFDQDISAVCGAYMLRLRGGVVVDIKIAHGGMAPISRRASQAETVLLGQRWEEATVIRAMQALTDDYQPMSDMRASSGYRLKAAQNLLYRFYLESIGTTDTRV